MIRSALFVSVALCVLVTPVMAMNDVQRGIQAYDKENYKLAKSILRPLADTGDPKAQRHIGLMYVVGNGYTQNFDMAMHWFRKCADQEHAPCMSHVGVMYENAEGIEQNLEEAVRWYRKSAELGDKKGQYNLGRLYEYGKGVSENNHTAAEWYLAAATQGDPDAQFQYAQLIVQNIDQLNYGRDRKLKFSTAVKYFESAAAQGVNDAKIWLGMLYRESSVVDHSRDYGVINYKYSNYSYRTDQEEENYHDIQVDNAVALRWVLNAAEEGYKEAYLLAGDLLSEEGEYGRAVHWYQKGADLGDLWCKLQLLYLHVRPRPGTIISPEIARSLDQQIIAESKGWKPYKSGIYAYFEWESVMHLSSHTPANRLLPGDEEDLIHPKRNYGFDPQMHTACKRKRFLKDRWFENSGKIISAAERGDADAMCHAGIMYRLGLGVPQNTEKAVFWLTRAYDRGIGPAAESLNSIYTRRLCKDYHKKCDELWSYDRDRDRYSWKYAEEKRYWCKEMVKSGDAWVHEYFTLKVCDQEADGIPYSSR